MADDRNRDWIGQDHWRQDVHIEIGNDLYVLRSLRTRFSEYTPWNYPPARLLKSHTQDAEGLMQPCDDFRDHRTCSIPRIIDFISEVNSVPNSVPYEKWVFTFQ